MDKKPTDSEIVKALEYCSQQGSMSECERCKIKRGCRFELIKLALDLINRLQAEQTELLGKIEDLEANRVELLEKMEQLEDIVTQNEGVLPKYKNYIKAEAYKEFAERLKLRFSGTLSCSGGVIKIAVDNLLKELVGDANESKI